jgi:hypothetical protein
VARFLEPIFLVAADIGRSIEEKMKKRNNEIVKMEIVTLIRCGRTLKLTVDPVFKYLISI